MMLTDFGTAEFTVEIPDYAPTGLYSLQVKTPGSDDAIGELKLRSGDSAMAIIKSTEVMIAREAEQPEAPRKRRRARR